MVKVMTPQEKAKELVEKFENGLTLKDCALIAVYEILEIVVIYEDISKDYEFYKQVKQEIEKL